MLSRYPPFPIDHPEFRYPPSRNPYWKKCLDLKGRIFSDQETETHRGNWRSTISADTKALHVEIGCNAGHVITEWASKNKDVAYIGLDWKFKMIFRAAEKAEKKSLNNVAFFRAHAERLPFMFGEGEIDHLSLFFPDPWPKKSQWKFRYFTSERLKSISKVVKQGGIFHVKTDHPGYFEWMLESLKKVENCWEVVECNSDLHQSNPNAKLLEIPEVTLFEKLFIQDGTKICSLKLRNKIHLSS